MTINEAIDRNKELKGELLAEGRLKKAEAVQFSIEALKWGRDSRSNPPAWRMPLLPGETGE